MARLTKQERLDFIMFVQQKYDLLMNIKEERGISYGELNYIENLKQKELNDLLEEIEEELDRITKLLKDYGYTE